uniref:CoA ligase n=1 Tax=Streptomyces sp. 31A4 TaxID=1415543 RepID=U5YPU7_9ACTN|nr:CoA ligase [Streptomyces sp. 31A4]
MVIDADDAIANSLTAIGRVRAAWENRPRAASRAAAHAEFLAYLRRSVPFYRQLAPEAELPLIGRAEHQADGEQFRPQDSPPPAHRLFSSGTTGQPLQVTLDDAAWYAVNYHFFAQIQELAGLHEATFRRAEPAVLFVSNKPGRPSFVRPLPSLNDGLYLRLQLPAGTAATRALFEKFRAPVLYGKPTYLLDLRAALLAQGLDRAPWSPRVLLVSGEPLHPDDRERLTDYFGAPMIDALASTEGGLIAATTPDEPEYRVLADNVRLEVLDGSGRTAPSGRGELVLTNLVNRSTVFARYRTGDLAELHTAPDGTQRLSRLRGREPETVAFHTRTLPADEVTRAIGFLAHLADFRFTKGEREHTLLLWSAETTCTDPETLATVLRHTVADLLPDEDVELRRCDRITPPGGKKRRFAL